MKLGVAGALVVTLSSLSCATECESACADVADRCPSLELWAEHDCPSACDSEPSCAGELEQMSCDGTLSLECSF